MDYMEVILNRIVFSIYFFSFYVIFMISKINKFKKSNFNFIQLIYMEKYLQILHNTNVRSMNDLMSTTIPKWGSTLLWVYQMLCRTMHLLSKVKDQREYNHLNMCHIPDKFI